MRAWLGGMVLLVAVGACKEQAAATVDAGAATSAGADADAGAGADAGANAGADASAGASAAPAADAPTEVAAQHILVTYKGAKSAPKSVVRSKADAKKRADEVVARIKAGDDFTSLVKTYSDDPGSADRLGSVGKFKRDKMDKAFAEAAFALKVDEVSGVVETPFGFHIIKRNQ